MRVRRFLLALSLVLASFPAYGQIYPTRPVKIVVPFAPGGSSDVLGRLIAEQLTKQTGSQFVVENKPGASGFVGTAGVAQSTPDGYTLIQVTAGTIALTPAMSPSAPFDARKDFAPLAFVASEPNALIVNPAIPIKTAQEFFAWAKAQTGKISYGSSGAGTPAHLGLELLSRAINVPMTHVPYRGAAPSVADVVAGHVQLAFPTMASATGQIASNAVRLIAVTGGKRLASFPDVPTVDELGMSELNVPIWYGYFAPAKTPVAIQERLHTEFLKALADPGFREKLQSIGLIPWTGEQKLADAQRFVDETIRSAQEIVEKTGIRVTP
jgi:tripartite-type tricarboxylate transporter receptor subunit TctC